MIFSSPLKAPPHTNRIWPCEALPATSAMTEKTCACDILRTLHTKFPANREFNREFRKFRAAAAISASSQRANSEACSQIPYATEQGIFAAITGNFFEITGNLIERAAKALSCCRTSNLARLLMSTPGTSATEQDRWTSRLWRDPGTRPRAAPPTVAARTRIVSAARIRLDHRKSVPPFKGIFCDDISEIAVGTLITERPPHRAERAPFGHSAPTSGI